MQKTYTSKSEVSINVCVGGRHRHLAFIPHTLGGSSLTVDDPALQHAIEHHRFFGTRIVAVETMAPAPLPEPTTDAPSAPVVMAFATLTEVKDYIAERWGVSRTMLRTKSQIDAVAAERGLTFTLQ